MPELAMAPHSSYTWYQHQPVRHVRGHGSRTSSVRHPSIIHTSSGGTGNNPACTCGISHPNDGRISTVYIRGAVESDEVQRIAEA